jgi:hypothetical protein
MTCLASSLRTKLEGVVVDARDIAEMGARAAIEALAINHHEPYRHMSLEDCDLRSKLRAHARQIGDLWELDGKQKVDHLVSECAYEHWHRMLFARFLAENNLLIEPENGVAISLEECKEIAKEERIDHWELASQYAQKMLPQIFRPGSPLLQLAFSREYQLKLEGLLDSLDTAIFTASDSLGWVYQFWQNKKKEKINKSEVKIGADELSAVTQLFTEPYMVAFLLDNSLGAWWAAHRLSETDMQNTGSELELRRKAAIPGVPLEYLRFLKQECGNWSLATGTFSGWPDDLRDFKTLDPCCGSGHFLVAAFLMLVPMRMEMEHLTAREAVNVVLRENIHGLELDQRCVELAAFALALTAWKFPDAGGYRVLPEINVACTGLAISANKEEWLALAGDNTNLRMGLEELYAQFKDAPLLGSLINPKGTLGKDTLFELKWEDVGPLLTKALAGEDNNEKTEMGIIASGITRGAALLSTKYNLIFTNPPYLIRGKQTKRQQDFLSSYYSFGEAELATVFLKRFDDFLGENGVHCSVTPLNWYYLKSYAKLRKDLLDNSTILNLTKIGSGATAKASWDVLRAVAIIAKGNSDADYKVAGLEAVTTTEDERALELKLNSIAIATANQIRKQPDSKFAFGISSESMLLEKYAWAYQGPSTADYSLYGRKYWEVQFFGNDWVLQHGTFKISAEYAGLENILLWESGHGRLSRNKKAAIRGEGAHNKKGIVVTQTRKLPASLYLGGFFDNNVAVLALNDPSNVVALWCYCSSDDYYADVRKLDEKLGVTNATLAKVPFDLSRWSKIAEEKYPNGLPKPYSDDPTQWIFHGHPCGSVVWDEQEKWTTQGPLRTDGTVLHVAVARLLGYRWPAELNPSMELSDEQREWVNRCEALLPYADDDGIVCLPALREEDEAVDRLVPLLAAAFRAEWSPTKERNLLTATGSKAKDLDDWLRNDFFEQHCKLFGHRPFVWHIWDGRKKDGFHAFVNYHKLADASKGCKLLEKLTYGYLGDWIKNQKDGVQQGVGGSEDRLVAALELEKRLKAILEGDTPFDIFVRWKPIETQPIGWEPDVNDGVRLNIRPFVANDIPGGRAGAGILRWAPNVRWDTDRGKDVESTPWYAIFNGDRINDHHLTNAEKRAARAKTDKGELS